MEQSGSQHIHHRKLVRSKQQLGLPGSQEKTLRPVDNIEREDMEHRLDPRQTDAEIAGTPNPFCANFSTTNHLIRVDRSEIVKPRTSNAQSLTYDNLCKLQTALADPSPLARWQSESMKVSAWNNIRECELGWNGDSVSPKMKEAPKGTCGR